MSSTAVLWAWEASAGQSLGEKKSHSYTTSALPRAHVSWRPVPSTREPWTCSSGARGGHKKDPRDGSPLWGGQSETAGVGQPGEGSRDTSWWPFRTAHPQHHQVATLFPSATLGIQGAQVSRGALVLPSCQSCCQRMGWEVSCAEVLIAFPAVSCGWCWVGGRAEEQAESSCSP